MIKLKRAYEAPVKGDGFRVLVDRLWPRGLTKAKAKIDLWLKEIAPSDALRRKFHHAPELWEDFHKAYRKELQGKKDAVAALRRLEKEHRTVTLIFSAKDAERNNAVALREFLIE